MKDHLAAGPVRFLPEAPADTPRAELLASAGALPRNTAGALERINALLPKGASALTAEQVWIHYAEALNRSFVSDRFMFVGDTTLRNYAKDAGAGFAFLNSHRTGGMLTDAELPYGKTFAGRYEQTGEASARTLVGFYMLRGVSPAGTGGPSTDDVHDLIDGGTLADVSAGLKGGRPMCDVCGESLIDISASFDYLCPHFPGTVVGMSAREMEAQRKKGVPRGCASYTYEDGHGSELSGVYDGAVTGAGFRFSADPAASFDAIAAKLSALLKGGETGSPAGRTFADHSQSVLAAVTEYVERAERYLATRREDARPASGARRADWEALAAQLARLADLGRDVKAPADPQRYLALRTRILKHRAGLTGAAE